MDIIFDKIIIIILLIFSGCSNGVGDPVLSEFNKVINIQGTTSMIKSSKIGEIVDMLIVDSLLIINEMYNDHIFKIFNVKTGELVRNSIKRGKGPNEMIFPRVISRYKDDMISTYDENQKRMILISIQELVNEDFIYFKTFQVENEMLESLKAFPINDSLIISTGMFKNGRYCFYNLNHRNGIVKFDYPFDKKHENESALIKGLAFQSSITIKPDLSKFVVTCSKSGNIEIFRLLNNDFELEFRKIYYLPQYESINNMGARFSQDNRLAFISQAVTDDYIYVVYSGYSREGQGSDYYKGRNLLVYNWEGQPILNFKLDRDIRDMTLDKINKIIYAYSINSITGEPEITIYNLPEH